MALLRVQNDILIHLDKSDTVMFVLLDLSAALIQLITTYYLKEWKKDVVLREMHLNS